MNTNTIINRNEAYAIFEKAFNEKQEARKAYMGSLMERIETEILQQASKGFSIISYPVPATGMDGYTALEIKKMLEEIGVIMKSDYGYKYASYKRYNPTKRNKIGCHGELEIWLF